MKTIFLISVLTIAMSSSFVVNAADLTGDKGQSSKVLSVTGSIGAPTCKFDMNSGQAVEFGTIAPSQLQMDQVTAHNISAITGGFSVECDAKTLVRLQVKDTYADSLLKDNKHKDLFPGHYGPDAQFGLVDANNPDTLIGSYIILKDKISTIDNGITNDGHGLYIQGGRPLNVFVSTKGNIGGGEQETLVIDNPSGYASKLMNVGFTIQPNFLPKKTWFTEGNDVEIIGDATFTMVYL